MSTNQFSSITTFSFQQNAYSGFLNFLRNRDYIIGRVSYCQFINEKKPMVAFDASLRILFINDLMKNLLEKDNLTVYGQLLSEVLPVCHNSNREEFLSPWKELIRNGLLIGQKYNCNIEFSQGKSVPVSLTGSPLFDKRGRFVGGVVFFQTTEKI